MELTSRHAYPAAHVRYRSVGLPLRLSGPPRDLFVCLSGEILSFSIFDAIRSGFHESGATSPHSCTSRRPEVHSVVMVIPVAIYGRLLW